METIYPSVVRSRLLIMAAPLVLGFPSCLLKKVQDRLIPLVSPFLLVINGEFRHEERYSNHPALGLLYQKEDDTDAEDVEIVTDIYHRLALNFQSRLVFSHPTDIPVQEMVDEISRI
jgi:multimeric flavodoxin WrbA